MTEHTDLVAELMYTQQGKYLEMIPHLSLKRFLDKAAGQAVLAGVCWRTRDAAILRMGYHQGPLQSGIAYDINISKFTAATNRRGAFEIYLSHFFCLALVFFSHFCMISCCWGPLLFASICFDFFSCLLSPLFLSLLSCLFLYVVLTFCLPF